jgi:hypothetical protein
MYYPPFGAGAWIPYTPSLSYGGGTPVNITAAGWWRQWGRTIEALVIITLTDIGTATGWIVVGTPTAGIIGAAHESPVWGTNPVTNAQLTGAIAAAAGTVAVVTAAGAFPGANGQRCLINMRYEI